MATKISHILKIKNEYLSDEDIQRKREYLKKYRKKQYQYAKKYYHANKEDIMKKQKAYTAKIKESFMNK